MKVVTLIKAEPVVKTVIYNLHNDGHHVKQNMFFYYYSVELWMRRLIARSNVCKLLLSVFYLLLILCINVHLFAYVVLCV
jgi:hypothetical protein